MRRMMIFFAALAVLSLACSQSSGEIASPYQGTSSPETAMLHQASAGLESGTPMPVETVQVPAGSPESAMQVLNCTVTGDLNLRSQPGPDAPVIGWLYTGDVVTADIPQGDKLAIYGDWRAVRTVDGLGGYAHGDWLSCGR